MNAVLDGLKALGAARLAALALVGVATLALFAVLTMRSSTQSMVLLYGDLDLREAGQIVDQLDRQHIAHQIGNGGSEILVPADQVAPARLSLARQGLPSGGSIGYEIFDRGDGFAANQFQENIDQLRALEGELSRTIRTIDGVRAARVNLVLPKREPFSRDRQEAQASVMLTTAGPGRLDHETVQAIVNLVAAAVPGLRPQGVTVVDNRGTLLARAGDPDGGAQAGTLDDARHALEQRLSRAIEEMLEPSIGIGHVRAEASVDMDLDRTKESDEKYDPDGQVVRSTQTTSDTSRSTEASPTVSVQNNLPNADAGAAANAAGNQDQKQDETTNYEIGKTVRTIVHDQPQIKRISLAVVVDGTEHVGADGKSTWQPRSSAELAAITKLVKSATGFDAKRGDQIEVETMRFATEQASVPPAPRGWLGVNLEKSDLMHLAQTLLVGLVAVVALLLVFRPMVLRLTTLPAAAGGNGAMLLASDGDAGAAFLGTDALPAARRSQQLLGGPATGPARQAAITDATAADESMINLANIEGQLRASSLRQLTDLVDKHPEESLSIVRSWMQQEAG
jgi:flagellar M-ring protein FliF